MNRTTIWLAAGALALATTTAQAQFSATVTAASDYDFRGYSQSAKDPALQLSLDYGFANGVYVGVWGSNIDFHGDDPDLDIGESVEVDAYLGWAHENDNGTSWDVMYIKYIYPGTDDDIDYEEFKVGFGYQGVTLEAWYSPDYSNIGTLSETWSFRSAYDHELAAGFTLNLGLAYNTGQYFKNQSGPSDDDASYWDYSIGVSKSWGHFDFAVKYIGTEIPSDFRIDGDAFHNDDRVIFSVSTTLPWGGEE